MDAYEIVEVDGEYVVLALGQPQLSFRTLELADSAVRQVKALHELPRWQAPRPAIIAPL